MISAQYITEAESRSPMGQTRDQVLAELGYASWSAIPWSKRYDVEAMVMARLTKRLYAARVPAVFGPDDSVWCEAF